MKKYPFYLLVALLALTACEPFIEDDITLGPLPAEPQFSVEMLDNDSNRMVITMLSDGFFDHLFTCPGGQPNVSKRRVDTIFYARAGEYAITLHASVAGGNGTSKSSQTVRIENNAVQDCTELIELLMGGCNEGDRKCWTFSFEAGAVTVGPTPGSSEWFRSTANSLQAEQYDDRFCFYFVDNRFLYLNNGLTVDPWNGYVPVPYTPPTDHTWTLVPRGGENGEDRLILTEGSFMGVWDASNIYDIVVLTEEELVVRTPFLNGDGWFELYFRATE
jgi:hypothetical protein